MAYAPHYDEIRQVLAKHQNEWKNELLADLSTAIETAIKNREREIAMEVEEMRKEPSYTDYEHEAYNQTLDKILSIINTPR